MHHLFITSNSLSSSKYLTYNSVCNHTNLSLSCLPFHHPTRSLFHPNLNSLSKPPKEFRYFQNYKYQILYNFLDFIKEILEWRFGEEGWMEKEGIWRWLVLEEMWKRMEVLGIFNCWFGYLDLEILVRFGKYLRLTENIIIGGFKLIWYLKDL